MEKITHGGFAQGIQTRQMNSQSLRIMPVFAPNFMKNPKYSFLKNDIVGKALNFWQSALNVKRPSNRNILIKRECVNDRRWFFPLKNGSVDTVCEHSCLRSSKCHTMEVPQEFLQACRTRYGTSGLDGSGIPGNGYLMIIDSSPGGLCSDGWLIAFANACQLEQNTDRPILGFINFCPNRLDEHYPMSKVLLYTAIHEMGHALGFNRNLYPFYRDDYGKPRTPRNPVTGMPSTPRGEFGIFAPSNNVLREVTRTWKSAMVTSTRKIGAFVLPKTLEFARSHFNCSSLDGVDLENEGSGATALTHFEKRVVNDELMSGSVELSLTISGLTLSVFQDSGWYDVDFQMAQDWKWGKNLGCDFVTKSCSEYMALKRSRNESTGPWCDYFDPTRAQCVPYNKAYNLCNMVRHQHRIPPDKQHVTNHREHEFLAGDSKLHDGCALFQAIPNIHGTGQTSVCTDTENNQRLGMNPLMQRFGPNSMCVNHGNKERWVLETRSGIQSTNDMGATCHLHQCGNGLTIMIGPKTISCPKQGGTVALNVQGNSGLIKGFVQCPSCNEVCGRC
uniref:Leishmanolysin-like peptidase n=1 Tax=Schistosoma mansoni TaxID=6183 RepID=A0A3Q0KQB5_SCHMA